MVVEHLYASIYVLYLKFISLFKIVLLTHRELKADAIENPGECLVIERTDAPTAKQVAVIWVQDEGLAPAISGNDIIVSVSRNKQFRLLDW